MRTRLWIALAALAALSAPPALASSHSEAPGTAKDRLIDDTDTYVFVSPDRPSTVTLIGNWVPLQEPAGGPNFWMFDDAATYYINVDNVGDAQDHIVFAFRFTTTVMNPNTFLYNTGPITSLDDPDFNVRQTYTVTRYDNGVPTVLGTGLPVPPNHIGPTSTPDYETLAQSAVRTLSDGTRVFAGQRDDPFFVDLGSIFDLLTIRNLPGDRGRGVDGVGGYNVLQIALQVPRNRLTEGGADLDASNAVIGVYTSATRPQNRILNADGTVTWSGPEVQVSRLGHPLVNEVVIPRAAKDRFNASDPTGDAQFLSHVVDPELGRLLEAVHGLDVPPAPRNDLVTVFLTGIPGLNQPDPLQPAELLRLNMSIPPTRRPHPLGVLGGDLGGFPNGRRLADDVTDIELRAVAGGYVLTPAFNQAPNNRLGDGVDFNDRPFLPHFPYQATPHQGFEHEHHPEQHGNAFKKPKLKTSDLGADAGAEPARTSGGSLALAGPNPAARSELQYTLEQPGFVTLRIYDVQGREVRTLVDQAASAGTFRAPWDGRDSMGRGAGQGVFFARFTIDGRVVENRKLVVE